MSFKLGVNELKIDKESLKAETFKKIKFVLRKIPRVLKTINNVPESKIRDTLWELRAELEHACVVMKYLLGKEYQKEKWQEEYLKEIKETGNKEKALKQIEDARITDNKFQKLVDEDMEKAYQAVWKLKEALSAGIKAFRTETYRIVKGKLEKESEEILEV